jgi:CspA family cold shock protein
MRGRDVLQTRAGFNVLRIEVPRISGEDNMQKGTVKFFNPTKGFGFIKTEAGQEVFVHVSGLKDDIKENDSVVFEVQEGKKGPNAVNVKLA